MRLLNQPEEHALPMPSIAMHYPNEEPAVTIKNSLLDNIAGGMHGRRTSKDAKAPGKVERGLSRAGRFDPKWLQRSTCIGSEGKGEVSKAKLASM
jgi:hypothetical protein